MVREQRVESFYTRLHESALSSANSPLLIFPSTSNVDSLCALKVIFHVLELDSVQYACYPVSSFREIHKYAGSSMSAEGGAAVMILLINWGWHRDLHRVLDFGPEARVFILDSHWPIHLHNLSEGNDQVVVLYTWDDEQQADLAYDFDVSALANASDLMRDEEGDDEASESEEENDSDSEEERSRAGSRKRRRISEENADDPVQLFRKLKKEYYRMGTFHGKPSECLMHDLSHSLRKNMNELLWLACVSLTDQFVHERLRDERYLVGVMELEQHINSSGNLDAVTSVTLKDGTKIHPPNSSRIAYEDEPRLMLLQEWNLFDSMLCPCPYGFCTRGLPTEVSVHDLEVKRKMKDEFERFLPEYRLSDFYYRSFLRLHGYSSRVSAVDMVYGVTALLESFVKYDGSCASKQFRVAYDTLFLSNLDKLKAAMQHAIKIQLAILRQGSVAITKSGSIRSGRKFRWVKLEDSVDTNERRWRSADGED